MGFALAIAMWEQYPASFSPYANCDAPGGCSRQYSPNQVITQSINNFNIQRGPSIQKRTQLMSPSSLVLFLFKKRLLLRLGSILWENKLNG